MARKGNKGLFNTLDNTQSETLPVTTTRKRKTTLLESRGDTLQKIAAGEVVNKSAYWVDPAICKMWSEHDRDYALLNAHNCEDLINGFMQQGHQEFPAIVRRLEDDKDFSFEVICGARRHWVVNYLRNEKNRPEYKFLVEVRKLSDEEAFRLSDIENRDRNDISDYERAVKYIKALNKYYRTQREMAERLEVTEDWLSKYLTLAKLPREIISAYPGVTDINVSHGRGLIPKLADPKTRKKIIDEANIIGNEQAGRRAGGQSLIEGVAVFKRLMNSVREAQPPKQALEYYKSSEGSEMLIVNARSSKAIELKVMLGSGASKAELATAFDKALTAFYE